MCFTMLTAYFLQFRKCSCQMLVFERTLDPAFRAEIPPTVYNIYIYIYVCILFGAGCSTIGDCSKVFSGYRVQGSEFKIEVAVHLEFGLSSAKNLLKYGL